MNESPSKDTLISQILNEHLELRDRIVAIQKLSSLADPGIINEIKSLFNRPTSQPMDIVDWDPVAVERVIDLHLVSALAKLGDFSEIDRISNLVAKAGKILQGPDNELKNACLVIKAIGRKEPVAQLIELTKNPNAEIVRNAVKVLNDLNLSNAPTGGNTAAILPPDKYNFKFNRLSKEMEILVNLSQGKITLSDGVKEFTRVFDFDRGNVNIKGRTLQQRVEQDLNILEFDYYIIAGRIVICTHQEAATKWNEWWLRYGTSFKFS